MLSWLKLSEANPVIETIKNSPESTLKQVSLFWQYVGASIAINIQCIKKTMKTTKNVSKRTLEIQKI